MEIIPKFKMRLTNKGSIHSNIKKMYWMKLLYNMYFYSAIIVPFYTQWGGIKFSQILLLNAWFMFWNFLLEIPTGTIVDFLGRKISLIFGCITGAAAAVFYVSYPHYLVFLGAEIVFAFSHTLLSGADEALVYDTLLKINQSHRSKKVFSNIESFKLVGIVIGALAGGFIAKYLGLRMPLLFQSIPLLIAAFLAATLKEPQIERKKSKINFNNYKKILKEGVIYFGRCKILKILTFDMIVIFSISWIIIWFYQALLKNSGVDIAVFGIVHSFMSIMQILIINNFFRIEKWLGSKKRLLFFSAFITGIFFILLGITTNAPLVIIAIILSSGFGLSRGPLYSNYMNKYIPSDKRATILSTISMLRTLSIVLMNTISGILADWSIPHTLIILGSLAIIFSFVSKIKEEDLID